MDQTVSPNWKRPEEVMKFHKLKQRKRALSARISGNDHVAMSFSSSSNSDDSFDFPVAKRRNPFARRLETIIQNKSNETTDESGIETDISNDTTLFHLLNNSQRTNSNVNTPKSFANILQHLNRKEEVDDSIKSSQDGAKLKQKDGLNLPIDWSLKSKVRLMSARSFSWSANLRTCEEASGITGFVRCLDVSNAQSYTKSCSIDTSPNAKFLQCCLYWQHPNIPWLQLFPRNMNKVNSSLLSAQLQMSPLLVNEWTIAFKSLFQLVRTSQCPFFYFIANHFQCLFRAAGIGGVPETHVIITPTTRGFRKMLDDEEVVYTMPLKTKRKSNEFTSDSDSSQLTENDQNSDDEEDDDWLESMGVNSKEIKKITMSQKNIDRTREKKIDGSSESMVVVQGIEVQALFNLLINCKSCVVTTGPLAGVPPTLISPTAFQLATLKSCKVRDSMIRVDGIDFHSIQIEGPIMPHALRQICILLNQDHIEYSASLSTVKQTIGFTNAFKFGNINDENPSSSASSVFLKENLSDCGLPQVLLNVFCDQETEKYGVIESIEPMSSDS